MSLSKRALCAIGIACTVVIAPTISAKELNLAIFAPPAGLVTTRIAQPWVDWAQQASGGELSIKIRAGGTLGRNPAQQLKLVQDGVADFAWIVPSYTASRFPALSVFELPGMIRNAREGSAAALALHRDGKLQGFEDVKLVGIFTTDTYDLHLSQPVASIDDLKGMKIRSGGAIQNDIISAFGAVPVGLPVTQIVESMSRNVVDATILNWTSLVPFKVEEVAKFHWDLQLGVTPLAFVMNRNAYQALSAKARSVIDQSPEMLAQLGGDAFEDTRTEHLKRFAADPKHRIEAPSAEQQMLIESRMATVLKQAETKQSEQIDNLRNALKSVRKN